MNGEQLLRRFDDWLQEDGPAALVLRQWLVAVEGNEAVIFPPTYPIQGEGGINKTGYNIDYLEGGTGICQIDSVGARRPTGWSRSSNASRTTHWCLK